VTWIEILSLATTICIYAPCSINSFVEDMTCPRVVLISSELPHIIVSAIYPTPPILHPELLTGALPSIYPEFDIGMYHNYERSARGTL
jgi:hypothetical protein